MKMMNFARGALGAAALLLGLSQAQADYAVNPATASSPLTVCGFSVSTVLLPCHVMVNSSKAELFTATTPGMVALTFGGSALTLGQKTGAGSIPVVLPSDGTLPLPTGAATATNQVTANTSLASIDAKTPALAVLPTLANQTAGNVSLASIATNTTGLATAIAQAATNTKLDTLIGQVAPTGLVGATPAAGTQLPWFQQAPGASFNVTTQSGTSLASPAYRIGTAVAGSNVQVFTPSGTVTPKKMLHAYFCNVAASARVLKFYDKATAPVPGTDAIVTSIVAPAGACPVIDSPAAASRSPTAWPWPSRPPATATPAARSRRATSSASTSSTTEAHRAPRSPL